MLKISAKQAAWYVGGVIVAIWLFREKAANAATAPVKVPTAMVDLGVPTVVGSGSDQLGGTDYYTNGDDS